MQEHLLWVAVGGLLLVALFAGFAEARRRRRRNFDAVGFMPWPLIQVLALIGALGLATLALKG